MLGSKRFLLEDDVKNRWEQCREARLQRRFAGAAFCLRSRANGTSAIQWQPPGTSVLGNTTFDPPTTLPNALDAWKRVL